jgi:hypothetical protein
MILGHRDCFQYLLLEQMILHKTLCHARFSEENQMHLIWSQDQVYTHMINVMSEISINNNKNIQELNHYIISLLH